MKEKIKKKEINCKTMTYQRGSNEFVYLFKKSNLQKNTEKINVNL